MSEISCVANVTKNISGNMNSIDILKVMGKKWSVLNVEKCLWEKQLKRTSEKHALGN